MNSTDIIVVLIVVVAGLLFMKAQMANLSSIDTTLKAILEELRSRPSS